MFRFFVITLMVAATLSLTATARADTPADSPAPVVQGSFDITIEFLGDTTFCGFPVDLTIHLKGKLPLLPHRAGTQPHQRRDQLCRLHDQREW
jgi:hypothetical protein